MNFKDFNKIKSIQFFYSLKMSQFYNLTTFMEYFSEKKHSKY